jgi:hypothetical protein
MKNSKMLAIIVFVTGISILGAETSGIGNIDSVLAQTTMDNATNATMMSQSNTTADAGNMTDANMTQSGSISGCGTECF